MSNVIGFHLGNEERASLLEGNIGREMAAIFILGVRSE